MPTTPWCWMRRWVLLSRVVGCMCMYMPGSSGKLRPPVRGTRTQRAGIDLAPAVDHLRDLESPGALPPHPHPPPPPPTPTPTHPHPRPKRRRASRSSAPPALSPTSSRTPHCAPRTGATGPPTAGRPPSRGSGAATCAACGARRRAAPPRRRAEGARSARRVSMALQMLFSGIEQRLV